MTEKQVYVWKDGSTYRIVAKEADERGITSMRATEQSLPDRVKEFVRLGYKPILGQATDGTNYPLLPDVEDSIRRLLQD